MKRMTFTPDELASGLDTMQRAGQVQGMFLSSGIIKGSVTTQDKIIDTAEIVRRRYDYRGYLHLKVMPGIEYDQLYRLMQLADRVSVNLEGPTRRSSTISTKTCCAKASASASPTAGNVPSPTCAITTRQ